MILNDEYSGWPLANYGCRLDHGHENTCCYINKQQNPYILMLSHTGMFGCGVQGMGHVEFITHTLKNLKKIYVHDARKEAMDNLIATARPKRSM